MNNKIVVTKLEVNSQYLTPIFTFGMVKINKGSKLIWKVKLEINER